MNRPRKGGLPSLAALALAGAAGFFALSCASAPADSAQPGQKTAATPTQAPQSTAPAPASGTAAQPASGSSGTSIQTSGAGQLTKVQTERKAIEEAIAFGSPTSLGTAFGLIGNAAVIDKAEARLLAWVGARVATIVYPLRSSSFVPADLLGPGEIPAGTLARMVSEALSGRVPDLPKELAGDPLGEILPSLAVFRSDSRETARLALASLDRFDLLGPPSVLPSIVRGLDAERRKAWAEGVEDYSRAIVLATDAWPAVIGAARSRLALGQPVEALALILAVPPDILNDADFRKVRAEALYDNGAFADADPLVALSLRDDPLDATLMLMRAHLLTRAKNWQQVLPLLDAYAIVDPTDRLYILLRGLSAEGLRSREEALRWARKGLGILPDDPEFLTLAARLLFSPNQAAIADRELSLTEARANAQRSFDLTADGLTLPAGLTPARLAARAEAGSEAARLLFEDAASRYDWGTAALYIERARKAPGFTGETLVSLVLRRSGNWPAALDHATLWYRDNPNSGPASEAYLRALIGTKNEKAAEDLLPRLLLGPASTAGRSNLHYIQSLLQKTEEGALASLRTALVENPDNVEALLGVYDIYYRRQDFQKARFYLKQALALSPSDPEITRRSRELDATAP